MCVPLVSTCSCTIGGVEHIDLCSRADREERRQGRAILGPPLQIAVDVQPYSLAMGTVFFGCLRLEEKGDWERRITSWGFFGCGRERIMPVPLPVHGIAFCRTWVSMTLGRWPLRCDVPRMHIIGCCWLGCSISLPGLLAVCGCVRRVRGCQKEWILCCRSCEAGVYMFCT
jgi:hypothetical protein